MKSKPSVLLEECLGFIKLMPSEKMLFDETFDRNNIKECVFEFFNILDTRYLCTSRNKVELLEAVNKLKKKL
jgi:hypothetical protein